ncbi:MAG: hypothetical protein AB2A00_31150 [Myxococcota bacterium]
MAVVLTDEMRAVLAELQPATSPEELQALMSRLAAPLQSFVREVMEPDQSVTDTRTELQDLYLLLYSDRVALNAVGFTEVERQRLRDAVRALLTVDGVFTKQIRFGEWRPRSVEEVCKASVPWRGKLRVKAAQAFFFDDAKVATYQDHNATGTLEEEELDLKTLVAAAKQDAAELEAVGFTADDLREGERLLAEAEGRDILGVIGIRTQADMKLTRNKLLTLCVLLARHARTAAASAHWNNPDAAARFERVSFRNAIRRIRPARATNGASSGNAPTPTPVTEPVDA